MNTHPAVFFDFDSTVVSEEALELVIARALSKHPNKAQLLAEVATITNLGMEGKIDFKESVRRRLAAAALTRDDFLHVGQLLRTKITPHIHRVFAQARAQDARIYIVSGGFEEFIQPTAQILGVDTDFCFANRCLYDESGNVIGVDEENPAWTSDGKHPVLEFIKARDNLQGTIVMIGDGASDLATYEHEVADTFIAFTAHAARQSVIERSPYKAASSVELQSLLTELLRK